MVSTWKWSASSAGNDPKTECKTSGVPGLGNNDGTSEGLSRICGEVFDALVAAGALEDLERHVAGFVGRCAGDPRPETALAAALASRAVATGHVCLRLDDPLAGLDAAPEDLPLPDPAAWARALAGSPAVGRPGEFRPLVLDGAGRLYLYRYWRYEHQVARHVAERAARPDLPVDRARARQALDRWFPGGGGTEPDFQRVAAATALLRPFTVISGGPGTGKTFTVVRLLAVLAAQPGGRDLRVALAAPTGKAAARLQEAVREASGVADLGQVPDEAFTLHRLLGLVPGSPRPRRGPDDPLPHDLVVVDEVSMVDVALMAKLLEALRPSARLVLVGDRDQLASVEAGAVLGDLCDTGRDHGIPPDFARRLEELTGESLAGWARPEPPPARSLVVLRRNWRFPADSPVGRATRAINAGRAGEALAVLREARGQGLGFRPAPPPEALDRALEPVVAEHFGPVFRVLAGGRPEEAFEAFQRFRILCALRKGPFGVEAVNRTVRALLARQGLVPAEGEWYPGRPVLVTRNDPAMGLFNGDVGLVFADPCAAGSLRVLFPTRDGGYRRVPPLRIAACETVFAMTVHKAQGSEFDRVLLILGDRPSRGFSRELVYTGITRARLGAEVWASEEAFRQAVERRAVRASGLRDALWGGEGG